MKKVYYSIINLNNHHQFKGFGKVINNEDIELYQKDKDGNKIIIDVDEFLRYVTSKMYDNVV